MEEVMAERIANQKAAIKAMLAAWEGDILISGRYETKQSCYSQVDWAIDAGWTVGIFASQRSSCLRLELLNGSSQHFIHGTGPRRRQKS